MIRRYYEKSNPFDLDKLNEEAFDGEIQKNFPIRYGSLKAKYGVCYSKIQMIGGIEKAAWVVELVITNFYKMDEEKTTGILLHEMIHAFMTQHGYAREGHGSIFMDKLNELKKKGYNIPIAEDVGRMEIDSEPLKKDIFGIIYQKPNGSKYAKFFRKTVYFLLRRGTRKY